MEQFIFLNSFLTLCVSFVFHVSRPTGSISAIVTLYYLLQMDIKSSLAMPNYNEPNISLSPKIIYIYKVWVFFVGVIVFLLFVEFRSSRRLIVHFVKTIDNKINYHMEYLFQDRTLLLELIINYP
jgi:hypothetical protein